MPGLLRFRVPVRPRGRRRALLALVAAVLMSLCVAVPPTATAARSGPAAVPRAACARHDAGIHHGLCFSDARGDVYWLGTLRGYDGVDLYCIDYAFATDWGVAHRRIAIGATLTTSTGGRVGAATVAALNRVVTQHPASGVDDLTAAAIGLIIREVMGDVRPAGVQTIPGGLTVAGRVRPVGFVDTPVLARATRLWDEARVHRGPWSLSIRIDRGPDGLVTAGERVHALLRGVNGSGGPQPMTVGLRFGGFTGPATVSLGQDGLASVDLLAPARPSTASVTARVDGAPGTAPVVIAPRNWTVNPRPGHAWRVSQRGLVGTQRSTSASAAVSTVIVRTTPTLHTEASARRVLPGASVHDTVVVAGTAGAPGVFFWSLLGPVQPSADGTCPGTGAAAWAAAGALDSGTVATTGDGTWTTPDTVIGPDDVGCLTYVESRPETPVTWPVSSPPGLGGETVLVQRPLSMPCVSTLASRRQALVGSRLRDRVRVGCIGGPDRVRVGWTAYGPLAPRAGATGTQGCARLGISAWRRARVAARGTVTAPRAGDYLTSPFTVRFPGCYTFAETVAATATTRATATPPGQVAETTLVTRPPVPVVPEVPTGAARAGARSWIDLLCSLLATTGAQQSARVGGPAGGNAWTPALHTTPRYLDRTYVSAAAPGPAAGSIRIDRLGIAAPVDGVALRSGVMAVPNAPSRVGWLRESAAIGDVVGASVVAGHVSDLHDRPGAFAGLGRVRVGDLVYWYDASGVRHRFVVTGIARYHRAGGLPASVFRTDGPHLLRLITCAGRVSLPGGGFHYQDNLVVTAGVQA